jgi:PhzF family phenazine biosynthesis protein
MSHTLYQVNAFTANGENGNPAGVVLHADDLNEQQMQSIATQAGFAETAFISKCEGATRELSFFTQTNEVDLCGHATIASWSLLHQKGELPAGNYTQQTKAGLLGVTIMESGLIFMEQNPASFYEEVPVPVISPLVGVNDDVFHGNLKPQIISTGIRDLFIPVKEKAALDHLVPDLPEIKKFSKEHDISGLHFFALLEGSESIASARNFAPADGIDEEAATGTSNGALLCYLKEKSLLPERDVYRIEQGESMGRLSYIYGKFVDDIVWVGGAATSVRESDIASWPNQKY